MPFLLPLLIVGGAGATGAAAYFTGTALEKATKFALVGGGLYLGYKYLKK